MDDVTLFSQQAIDDIRQNQAEWEGARLPPL